ncbi:hypothetical protein DFP72DRAFT_848669 [Ephemerocybe angulata]|uniref:Uncharacterized protein n=1 Tax=Ephemerocybe angulata TaxID=980116 RepID=A0A8H6HXG4_9AGAR|nr:hypothetical protein DFP72DRAFT_848669 [Tulosesus angulatus]
MHLGPLLLIPVHPTSLQNIALPCPDPTRLAASDTSNGRPLTVAGLQEEIFAGRVQRRRALCGMRLALTCLPELNSRIHQCLSTIPIVQGEHGASSGQGFGMRLRQMARVIEGKHPFALLVLRVRTAIQRRVDLSQICDMQTNHPAHDPTTWLQSNTRRIALSTLLVRFVALILAYADLYRVCSACGGPRRLWDSAGGDVLILREGRGKRAKSSFALSSTLRFSDQAPSSQVSVAVMILKDCSAARGLLDSDADYSHEREVKQLSAPSARSMRCGRCAGYFQIPAGMSSLCIETVYAGIEFVVRTAAVEGCGISLGAIINLVADSQFERGRGLLDSGGDGLLKIPVSEGRSDTFVVALVTWNVCGIETRWIWGRRLFVVVGIRALVVCSRCALRRFEGLEAKTSRTPACLFDPCVGEGRVVATIVTLVTPSCGCFVGLGMGWLLWSCIVTTCAGSSVSGGRLACGGGLQCARCASRGKKRCRSGEGFIDEREPCSSPSVWGEVAILQRHRTVHVERTGRADGHSCSVVLNETILAKALRVCPVASGEGSRLVSARNDDALGSGWKRTVLRRLAASSTSENATQRGSRGWERRRTDAVKGKRPNQTEGNGGSVGCDVPQTTW